LDREGPDLPDLPSPGLGIDQLGRPSSVGRRGCADGLAPIGRRRRRRPGARPRARHPATAPVGIGKG
jgi:hypothetical protein